jgi:predicted dehydrogenase
MTPLRFLLLGAGGITAAHLPAFRQHPERLRVAAVCDPSEAAREGLTSQLRDLGPVRAHENHESALAQERGAVDAVLIATPHHLHLPQARACVEAGLPVLVEKPLCRSRAEALALRDLARRHRILVVSGQNRRYDLRVEWLRDWIEAAPENFGELRSFELFAFQNILSWIATKPNPVADFWILDRERAGGGVVISLLIHLLDLLRALTGLDYAQVSARSRQDPPFRGGAESVSCGLLTMSNGAVGTFHANYLAPRHPRAGEGLCLFGSEGMVRQQAGWAYASAAGQGAPPWGRPDEGLSPLSIPAAEADPLHSFTLQLLAFADAVRTGTLPRSHLEENLNTLAVIDAIEVSAARDGAPVEVAID